VGQTEKAVKDASMITTDSGLQYYDFKHGGGPPVKAGQVVTMHYIVARTFDAIEEGPWLDNSWKPNQPIRFRVGEGQVIKGIDEGIQGMMVAGHRWMIVPPELAFGRRGVPGRVLPNATLCLEIYIVEVENAM
jgi:FKBP-type peptidyl-prolyl cis-trans isomerase